jgi:putative Holliday junction resolvase
MSIRGRRLAFDYGDARIGVAICDPDGILATPLPYLRNSSSLKKELSQLIAEHAPLTIYVGEPKNLSGESSATSAKVADFVSLINQCGEVPVVMIDERLSTVEASRRLREGGIDARAQRELVDSMAAVGILEAGLARE